MGELKTILVTGGNRGIGLEICRQLDKPGYTVILGSRDYQKGVEAARPLSSNVIVRQLDVTSEESILNLFSFLDKETGKLDILVNNAGIQDARPGHDTDLMTGAKNILETRFTGTWQAIQKARPVLSALGIHSHRKDVKEIPMESVKKIMETNFYGPWRMIQVFLPLLKKSDEGRIINISSGMGEFRGLAGDFPGYRASKVSLNALTIMFSKALEETGIKVNAMCPGWVKTDMGGPNAPREVGQGADTAVWLATESNIPTGKFFRDRKEIDW